MAISIRQANLATIQKRGSADIAQSKRDYAVEVAESIAAFGVGQGKTLKATLKDKGTLARFFRAYGVTSAALKTLAKKKVKELWYTEVRLAMET